MTAKGFDDDVFEIPVPLLHFLTSDKCTNLTEPNQKVKSFHLSTKYWIHAYGQNSQNRVTGRFSRYFLTFGMLATFCLCV